MGVLDWLNDAIGGSASTEMSQSPGMAAGLPQPNPPSTPAAPPPPSPAPPMTASLPIAPPAGMDASGSPLPSPQPIPLPPGGPQPDTPPMPPGGPQGASPPAPMPPAAPPQGTGGPPPGPPMNLQPANAGPTMAPPGGASPGQGPLARALGLDANQAKTMQGSLAAGLKSVGTNWNKPGLAAFAGSAGSGLEGTQTTQDKTYDQKIKYLQQAIAAQSAGDKSEYNKNYAAYLTGKLKNDTDNAAAKDGSAGKKGAWNKPDSQKFIDAQHALANDPDIKASQKLLEQTARTGEPADVAKAQAAHTALVQQKQAMYLAGVGLNPQKVQQQAQNPPGTQGNPHIVTSKEDFDQYVKPGDAFVNPKDGKVYIRKGGQGGDSAAPTGGTAPATPSAPEAPGAEPGTKTEDDD